MEITDLQQISQPPGLKALLEAEGTTVSEVLAQPLTFRLFRQEDPLIIEFFVNHALDLLNLVFSNNAPELSAKAFAIFEHCDPRLTAAMLQNQMFHHAVCDVLKRSDVPPLFLSRISSLTYVIYIIDPSNIQTTCGFILQLLSLLSESTVLSLFEALCKSDQDNIQLQKWLIQIGFVELLHREVDCFQFPAECDRYNSAKGNLLSSYFYLIKICAQNSLFSKLICSHSFVSVLNRTIGDYPQYIEDARWEALSAIYHPRTQEMMRGLFQSAVDIVNDPQKCRTRSAIAAISILKNMMKNDELLRPFIFEMNLPVLILNIMIKNHSHSILHRESRLFVSAFFDCGNTNEIMAKEIMKIIVENSESEICHLRASLKHLANSILVGVAKKQPQVVRAFKETKNFSPSFTSMLKKYDESLNTFYGGVADSQSDEVQSLAMMALSIFRYF